MSKESSKKETNNSDKFTTAFDILYEKEKGFAELIIKHRLTRVSVNRSLIIPPKAEIKRIKEIKDKASRINNIMHYILRSKVSPSRLVEMKDKGGKLYTLRRNYFYPVESDGKTFKLNGVKVSVVKQLGFSTLYKADKKLIPIQYVKTTESISKKSKSKKATVSKKASSKTKSKTESKAKDKSKVSSKKVGSAAADGAFSDLLYKIVL